MIEYLYENWTELERGNLREIYLIILDKLSQYYYMDGSPETAIHLCETILSKDNCREDIYQRIMECYYKLGKREKALKKYQQCIHILRDELDIEPTRSLNQLFHKIKNECPN